MTAAAPNSADIAAAFHAPPHPLLTGVILPDTAEHTSPFDLNLSGEIQAWFTMSAPAGDQLVTGDAAFIATVVDINLDNPACRRIVITMPEAEKQVYVTAASERLAAATTLEPDGP